MAESIDILMTRARPPSDDLDRERIAAEISGVLFDREPAPVEVGRFLVEARVGSGGMGIVYRGYDPELQRRVAIKVLDLRRIAADTAEARARLLGEARALARLAHPNVVAVHDVGTLGGRVYLVMEYVDGPTLRRWMQRERPLAERLELLLGAGRGLAAAHASGLIHGDFKPENILVGEDRRARVVDFGLALPLLAIDGAVTLDGSELSESDEQSGDPSVTLSSMFGTPSYIAPEQLVRRRLDARADQFSFCVVACELLCGRRPFEGDNLDALAGAALAGRIEAFGDRQIPRRAEAVIRRGLAPDPADRFADMNELLARLEGAFDRGRIRRRVVAAALTLGLVGAASAGVAVSRREPASDLNACVAAEARLAPIWSRERARAVDARLGRPAAAKLAIDRIDARVGEWGRAWTRSCTATVDSATRERMQACLDARLLELESVIGALAHERERDAPLALLEQLGSAVVCLDSEQLDAARPVPLEPERRREVEEVRNHEIAKATLAAQLERSDEALELAREALAKAERLGYRPLEAEAQFALARALQSAEQRDAAVDMAEAAHLSAEASRHVAVLADSAVLRVRLAYESADLEAGHEWLARAEAANEATGGDPDRAVRLYESACMLELLAGDYELAIEQCGRAQSLIDAGARIDTPSRLRVAINFASAEYGAGRLDQADIRFAAAEQAVRDELGPTHPWLVNLGLNWGHVAYDRGELERASLRYRSAQRLLAPNSMSRSETSGAVLVSLADVLRERGELRAAELEYRAALELARGIDDYWTMHVARLGLGWISLERGDFAAARDAWTAQLADERERLEPEHPWMLALQVNIGAARSLGGEVEAGLAQIDAAIAILEREHGPQHPELADDLWVRGHVARVAGDCRRALDDLERAHAIELARSGADSRSAAAIAVEREGCRLTLGEDPAGRIAILEASLEILRAGSVPAHEGLARYELGRAYARADRPEQARAELVRARGILEREQGDYRALLDSIATLLAAQR